MEFQVAPDNIVNLTLTSCDNWNAICVFTKRVLVQQRLDERARSADVEGSTH